MIRCTSAVLPTTRLVPAAIQYPSRAKPTSIESGPRQPRCEKSGCDPLAAASRALRDAILPN